MTKPDEKKIRAAMLRKFRGEKNQRGLLPARYVIFRHESGYIQAGIPDISVTNPDSRLTLWVETKAVIYPSKDIRSRGQQDLSMLRLGQTAIYVIFLEDEAGDRWTVVCTPDLVQHWDTLPRYTGFAYEQVAGVIRNRLG